MMTKILRGREMTKADVLEWLLVLGRDWVSFKVVNERFGVANKIKWAYDDNYLHYMKEADDSGNNKYMLAPKALQLLENDSET